MSLLVVHSQSVSVPLSYARRQVLFIVFIETEVIDSVKSERFDFSVA